ncbi:unnamed protein product [Parnassius apollo]|uniref:(apollo) hypothetical protein n=1 Tax=Parnassius apollo TaxID=110799 RepID=A0A8S3Y4R1_PARAO|nr:unnamed protein product [Parnassius apollo]
MHGDTVYVQLSITARELFDYIGSGGGVTTPPKVVSCRAAASRASAHPMQPGPLAALEPQKTRALTTIYAPRKSKSRKNRTAQNRMLDSDMPVKTTVSPFRPLSAIVQKQKTLEPKAKVIVFDLNRDDNTIEKQALKLQEVLKPLTPLSIHGFQRKNSLHYFERRHHRLLRENTYDVIEPVYLNTTRKGEVEYTLKSSGDSMEQPKLSPKSRFKRAAIHVAKLSSTPETGKLLCMREKERLTFCLDEEKSCKLQELPQSPAQKINKLSEIFQRLEMKGRHRDKMKKENSWF